VIKIDIPLDILLSSERRDVMKLLHEFFAPLRLVYSSQELFLIKSREAGNNIINMAIVKNYGYIDSLRLCAWFILVKNYF